MIVPRKSKTPSMLKVTNQLDVLLLVIGYRLKRIEATLASALFKTPFTFDDDLSRQHTLKKYRSVVNP